MPGGIRTRNPSKKAAADPLLRPRGHRDRLFNAIKPETMTELSNVPQ